MQMGLRGQEHKQTDPISLKPQDAALVELLATRRTPHQRDPRGNPDTHIQTYLQILGQGCQKKEKGRKTRVSTKARTRETRIQLRSSTGYMVDLAATKAIYYRDTLQLSSTETR
jgi:hypothetical protein